MDTIVTFETNSYLSWFGLIHSYTLVLFKNLIKNFCQYLRLQFYYCCYVIYVYYDLSMMPIIVQYFNHYLLFNDEFWMSPVVEVDLKSSRNFLIDDLQQKQKCSFDQVLQIIIKQFWTFICNSRIHRILQQYFLNLVTHNFRQIIIDIRKIAMLFRR